MMEQMNVIVYCAKCYDDKFRDAMRVPQGDLIYIVEIRKCLCLLHLIRSRKKEHLRVPEASI